VRSKGIESSEIERQKSGGECLGCSLPSDRKGNNRVNNCFRPIELNKGTASYLKAKEYQMMRIAGMQLSCEEEDTASSDSESSEEESDSEESRDGEESDGECFDEEETEGECFDEKKRNYWGNVKKGIGGILHQNQMNLRKLH